MKNISKDEQYGVEIFDLLINAFSRENEDQKWEVEKIDATAWFTGLIKGAGLLYNKFTNDEKTYFEFTQLLQNLIVQNMLENKDTA